MAEILNSNNRESASGQEHYCVDAAGDYEQFVDPAQPSGRGGVTASIIPDVMECELTRDERFNRGNYFLRLFHLLHISLFIYHENLLANSVKQLTGIQICPLCEAALNITSLFDLTSFNCASNLNSKPLAFHSSKRFTIDIQLKYGHGDIAHFAFYDRFNFDFRLFIYHAISITLIRLIYKAFLGFS